MPSTPADTGDSALASLNQRFYDRLWTGAYFVGPERFNTWPILKPLAQASVRRLEVGPGLRPRLPIPGTHFFDISQPAVDALNSRGGVARRGDAATLPYNDAEFDLVCALDIIEHISDQDQVLSELTRVLSPTGTLILAVPLHPELWTRFDAAVGHARRYTEPELLDALARHDLQVTQSAAYGMQSSSRALLNFTASGFHHMPRFTMFIYNYLVLPLGMALQKPLNIQPGLIDTRGIDELLLFCTHAQA